MVYLELKYYLPNRDSTVSDICVYLFIVYLLYGVLYSVNMCDFYLSARRDLIYLNFVWYFDNRRVLHNIQILVVIWEQDLYWMLHSTSYVLLELSNDSLRICKHMIDFSREMKIILCARWEPIFFTLMFLEVKILPAPLLAFMKRNVPIFLLW